MSPSTNASVSSPAISSFARALRVSVPCSLPDLSAVCTAFSTSRWAVTPKCLRNFRRESIEGLFVHGDPLVRRRVPVGPDQHRGLLDLLPVVRLDDIHEVEAPEGGKTVFPANPGTLALDVLRHGRGELLGSLLRLHHDVRVGLVHAARLLNLAEHEVLLAVRAYNVVDTYKTAVSGARKTTPPWQRDKIVVLT